MHPKNESQHKIYLPFQHKVDYEGDIDENNCDTDKSQSDNDILIRNLDKEQDNKEHDECKKCFYVVAKTNELKMRKSKV